MKRILCFFSMMSIVFLCCSCATKAEKDSYANGTACLAQERYVDAANFYLAADGYKDSSEKLLEIYYYAVNQYETENYTTAKNLFDLLAEADIGESDKYCITIERLFAFNAAMENAKMAFEDEEDVAAALNWQAQALENADTEVQIEQAKDYGYKIRGRCYKDTHFLQLAYFDPYALIRDPVAESVGEYQHYYYEIKHYYRNPVIYSTVARHLTAHFPYLVIEQLPDALRALTGKDDKSAIYFDELGNGFLIKFNSEETSSCTVGYYDIFIFSEEFLRAQGITLP